MKLTPEAVGRFLIFLQWSTTAINFAIALLCFYGYAAIAREYISIVYGITFTAIGILFCPTLKFPKWALILVTFLLIVAS